MSKQTPTLDLSSTLAMISAKCEKSPPNDISGSSLSKGEEVDEFTVVWINGSLAIFSRTTVTVLVSLCARLIHSAIRDIEFVNVVAPTVDPGLDNTIWESVRV